MFEIEKKFRFEAGHTLLHHDGKCSSPHGHSYVLTIVLRSQSLISDGPKQSMVRDFQEISDVVKPMIDQYFDHKWLNETLSLDSPTAERIAEWIFKYVQPKIPQLYKVSVRETESSSASFWLHPGEKEYVTN
jgi:6-pyruvoyltetrahydropterin/6-carboxytetrahydropterin synthase